MLSYYFIVVLGEEPRKADGRLFKPSGVRERDELEKQKLNLEEMGL